MAITVSQIAQIAGVSRGTVDRALKNRAGVSPATKAKILRIAKENNYQPNLIGKALSYSNHDIAIEVIMNSVGNSFFENVKKGILDAEKAYKDYGIKVNINEIKGYNVDEIINKLDNLSDDVKNVILTPVDNEKLAKKINSLTDNGVNIITLSSDISNSKRISYIGCDYLKSGKIAGRMVGLLSNGCANVCIVTGSVLHCGHRKRVEGVKSLIKEYKNIKLVSVIENNDDNETAYNAMKNLLAKNPDIDFVCITAGGVTGTLKAIEESKRDIKVCSFDDTPTTRNAMKNGKILATVSQESYLQGYNAIKTVFDKVVAGKEIKEYQLSNLYIKVDQSI